MNTTPIMLSICIPTFNRGSALQKTLDSIVCQNIFLENSEIEIVISDNCSNDNTQAICEDFALRFSEKIRYFRSDINIGGDNNFERVLSKASGAYMKLHNDNLYFRDGALAEIIKVIRATETERPIIFFTNGNKPTGNLIEVCNTIDEFIHRVSFFATWIGGFGIWKKDFEGISDFSANAHLKLVQTDILYRLLSSGKRAIILYDNYFGGTNIGRKGGYNIAEVFGKNYLLILKQYLATGLLSKNAYEAEKRTLLIDHIIPYYFSKDHDFLQTGFFEYLQDYSQDDYFYKAIEDMIHKKPAG